MDMDVRTRLSEAICAIAGLDSDRAQEQNNVGFSKIDSGMGHSLARTPPESWSLRETVIAWRIAKRYANTQLPMLGIDVSGIPEPELPKSIFADRNPTKAVGPSRVTIVEGAPVPTMAISWPYEDPDFERKKYAVKEIPGRRWESVLRVWTVPVTEDSMNRISELYAAFIAAPSPFEIAPEVSAEVDAAIARFAENVGASYADTSHYEPSGLTTKMSLYPFQRAGVEFMTRNKKVILADEMGLGKTPQAIAAVADKGSWPALVVCPASLKLNWRREFRQWTEDAETLQIHVASGRSAYLDGPVDVLIINYDLLDAWKDLLAKMPWNAVIADEAHYLKSHKALRTKAFKHVIKNAKPSQIYMLTGTPFLSRPIEGWSLIDILGHGGTFGGWNSYTERYCGRTSNGFGMVLTGAANLGELNQKLRSSGIMIRRKKAEVLKELPPRRWVSVDIEMSTPGAREYVRAEQSLSAYMAEMRSNEKHREEEWEREARANLLFKTEEDVAAEINRRRREYRSAEAARLEQSEQLIRFEGLKKIAYEGKRKMVFEWIDEFLESDQKLIVFAHHRDVVLEIAERYNAPTIMGGQKTEDVEAGKQRFQTDPKCRVIVCNIKAGGVGHTLTAASDVAFVELGWTPADMDQALDRAHRIGQENSVTGWVLNATLPKEFSDTGATIDTEISMILDRKRQVVERATDGDGVVEQIKILDELRQRLDMHKKGNG